MDEPSGSSQSHNERDVERMLCPGCMTPNDPRADYCVKCGMPLGACAGMDPLKSIYLQGRLYRQATSGTPPLIALIGMWLLLGPFVLLGVFVAVEFFRAISGVTGVFVHPKALLALPVLGLYAAILYKVTRNYARSRRLPPGSCGECGYLLLGLREPRCPECGTPFNWEGVQDELKSAASLSKRRPRPPCSEEDLAYAIAVGLCYACGFGPLAAVIRPAWFGDFAIDLLGAVPYITQVAGLILLLLGIRTAYRQRNRGLSRVFVIAFVASILLALGIQWLLLAFL